MKLWDAIVIGAGPAGCAAAYDLAAAGRGVLLLDKALFPRSKACAGGLTMKAVRALRYSITPVVRKSVCEAVLEQGAVKDQPREQLRVARRTPFCVMTVRRELDEYCLAQTQDRGAVFRRIGPIIEVEQQANRVLLYTSGGQEPFTARFVVGADGVHSRVRALLAAAGNGSSAGDWHSASWLRTGFALEANVPYSATGREFPLVFDFAPVRDGYGWLFPRNDHVNVGLYSTLARAADRTGPPLVDKAALSQYIALRCGTNEHEPAVGQFLGFGAVDYRPAGTRVLLAGDAAGFVDPLTGEGIYGAIVSGQSAAAAILKALREGGDSGSYYRIALRRQCDDLAVSESAAKRFYPSTERGFRLMRSRLARRAVLHAYGEGGSLATLTRGIKLARRLTRS